MIVTSISSRASGSSQSAESWKENCRRNGLRHFTALTCLHVQRWWVRDDDEKPEREFEAHTWWEPIQEKWGGSGAGTCRLFVCSFALSTGRRLKFIYFYAQSHNKKKILKFCHFFQFCLQITVDPFMPKKSLDTIITANLGHEPKYYYNSKPWTQ